MTCPTWLAPKNWIEAVFAGGDHGSKSWSQPPTRRALRRIGLGISDRTRAIHAKRYIES